MPLEEQRPVSGRIVRKAFYSGDDVVAISKALLGKILCSDIDGRITKAVITETEAYAGETDKASHAYGGRRTKRTEILYATGGTAYVYLCYGIHHLFNVVTSKKNTPHAALIRAGLPFEGVEHMRMRRGPIKQEANLLSGPGSLAKAMGITTDLSGTSLVNGSIWIEHQDIQPDDDEIVAGPRVGIDYAEEDTARPYRFILTTPHV